MEIKDLLMTGKQRPGSEWGRGECSLVVRVTVRGDVDSTYDLVGG